MHGLRRWVAAIGLALVLAGCATVNIDEQRLVQGRVTDDTGKPVPNTPVVLIGRYLDFEILKMSYKELHRQELRTTTDKDGLYQVQFFPPTLGNNFYIFFYDKTGFNGVKYVQPETREITDLLKKNRDLTVNEVLRLQPGWAEVERQAKFYGENSEKAQILLQNGLPEKRDEARPGSQDLEVWWYYKAGVSYWFGGDKLVRTQQFTPMPGGAPWSPPK
jgi:hypothetical protein